MFPAVWSEQRGRHRREGFRAEENRAGGTSAEGIEDLADSFGNLGVLLPEFLDLANGVENGRVMLSPEVLADLGKGQAGDFLTD